MGVYRFKDRVIDPQKYPWGYGSFWAAITIDSAKIDSDLTHFPLPIPLGSSVGINNFNMQRVFDAIGSDYQKLRVTDSDGNDLYVEVEQWDTINKKGLLWISRDTWTIASASDTKIYLAFDPTVADNTAFVGTPGNRTEVWDSGYELIYHMSQDPSGGVGAIKDSTVNARHGTPNGSMGSSDLIAGKIGECLDFDGTDDFIDPSWASLGSLEVSCWYNTPETSDNMSFLGNNTSGGDDFNNRQFGLNSGEYTVATYPCSHEGITGSLDNSQVYPISTWTHFVGQMDKTGASAADYYLYENGVLQINVSDGYGETDAFDFYIGAFHDGHNGTSTRFYQGKIDEFRVSSVIRSADWIKADYHAQTDNLLTFE